MVEGQRLVAMQEPTADRDGRIKNYPLALPAAVGLVVASALAVFVAVSRAVPEPYMDEIFHVRQTQAYCAGNFSEWDPKITTPPGLYLLAVLYVKAWQLLSMPFGRAWHGDAGPGLRFLNVVLGGLCFLITQRLHQRLHPDHCSGRLSWWMAVAATLMPLHYFFIFLFYTDVLSTTLVLASYLAVLERRPAVSAILSLSAVLVRQTNAVWAVFTLGVGVYSRLQPSVNKNSSDLSLTQELHRLIQLAWQLKWSLVRHFWGLVGVPLLFAAFLKLNGGVVLGDKTNHAAVFHPTQLLYLALYVATVMAPVHFAPSRVAGLAKRASAWARESPALVTVSAASSVVACALTVWQYTLVHPFTLADNRHYVFYLWRKLLGRHPLARYAMTPAYIYSGLSVGSSLGSRQPRVWILMFCICTALTLMPALLVELRYYTIPTMLTMLHMNPPSLGKVWLTIAGYVCVNAITLAVFLYKPFQWNDGTVARFMW